MRASIIDLMPDPLSPLFETLGMRIFFDKMQKLVSMLSNSDYVLKGYSVTTINGYAYFAMNLSVGELLFLMIRVFPSVLINMGGRFDNFGFRRVAEQAQLTLNQPHIHQVGGPADPGGRYAQQFGNLKRKGAGKIVIFNTL